MWRLSGKPGGQRSPIPWPPPRWRCLAAPTASRSICVKTAATFRNAICAFYAKPYPHLLNLEMACVPEIVDIACEVKPDQVTLVPERREELTTEGGLDVVTHQQVVGQTMERLTKAGIHVALFLDPDDRQIEIARRLGAKAVEIQTARYSDARTTADRERELAALTATTEYLRSHNMHVHMGHGLNYWNVQAIARIAGVEELNIGHSIVSRAVLVGMERAVREMKEAIRNS